MPLLAAIIFLIPQSVLASTSNINTVPLNNSLINPDQDSDKLLTKNEISDEKTAEIIDKSVLDGSSSNKSNLEAQLTTRESANLSLNQNQPNSIFQSAQNSSQAQAVVSKTDLSKISNKKTNIDSRDSQFLKVPRKFLFKTDLGNDNSSIVAQINLGKVYTLDDAAMCYQERDRIFVSFAQFVDAVGFPIHIFDDLSGASGWFIEEKRLFVMNFESSTLLVNGKRFQFDENLIRVIDGEIYFSIDLLQKIFPLKIKFDSLEQMIEIISLEPLPIELAMARERKWDEFIEEKKRSEEVDDQEIAVIKSPYKAISSPIFDLRYNKGFKKMPGGKSNNSSNLNVLASGDLLYLNHQLFLNLSGSQISNARITSGRKDPQGGLLGPLKATEFQFGDIISPQNSLVLRGGQIGKGATISNFPEEFVSGFDRIVIRGNMQAGWDAELYRNDQLLLFQKVSAAGVYEFQDVPLVSGPNIIRLVFYGPFGQKREEIRKYYSSEGLIKKGKFYYRISGNKYDETLFNLDKKFNNIQEEPIDRKNRYYTQFLYGLSKNASLIADFAKTPIQNDGESSSFNSFGIRSSIFGIYTDLTLSRQLENKANATQISAQTKLFNQSLTLKNQHFSKDFVSEVQQFSTDPLINLVNLRLDGAIGKENSGLMNSFQANRFDYFSKNHRLDLQDEISFNIGSKTTITQNIRNIFDTRQEGSARTARTGGNLLNHRFSRTIGLRSAITYDVSSNVSLTQASNTIDYTFSSSSMLNFSHNYQFPQAGKSGATNYVASLSRQFNELIASVSGSYNGDDKSYGLNLNLSMSVGYDMRYRSGIVSATPMVSEGIISARIFLDKNNNGVFDKDESGLENIGLVIDNQPSVVKSDKKGRLIVGRISTKNAVKIKVNSDDISDPSLIVKKPVFKLLVHPGNIVDIDFPIVPSGEISGTVKILKAENKSIFAASVRLELVDLDGKLVKETVSAYDGFYSFDLIPVGAYKIRISPSQMKRLGMISKQSEKLIELKDFDGNDSVNFEVIAAISSIPVQVQEINRNSADSVVILPINKGGEVENKDQSGQVPTDEEALQEKLLSASKIDSDKAAKEGENIEVPGKKEEEIEKKSKEQDSQKKREGKTKDISKDKAKKKNKDKIKNWREDKVKEKKKEKGRSSLQKKSKQKPEERSKQRSKEKLKKSVDLKSLKKNRELIKNSIAKKKVFAGQKISKKVVKSYKKKIKIRGKKQLKNKKI